MNRFRTTTLALCAAGLAGAAALPALLPPQDLTALPEPIESVARKVQKSPVRLADAVATAEREVGGLAREAQLLFDSRGAEVWVYTESEAWHVKIREDGEILSKEKQAPFALPGWEVDGEPTKTASGLMYYDVVQGTGATPPGATTRVRVHYTGYLLNGTKFDSSVDRGTPLVFPLNGVIKGWTEGVGSMKVGGKRKLVIPHTLAYGERGSPPTIPPRAMLVFDVELIEIVG